MKKATTKDGEVMRWYRCKKCGYTGDRLIYSFTDYTYVEASNDSEPEIMGPPLLWVTARTCEVGEPIGCPECRNWGKSGFELTEEASAVLAEAEIAIREMLVGDIQEMITEKFDVAEPQVLQISQIKKDSTPSDCVCHPSRGELGHTEYTEKEDQIRKEDSDAQNIV